MEETKTWPEIRPRISVSGHDSINDLGMGPSIALCSGINNGQILILLTYYHLEVPHHKEPPIKLKRIIIPLLIPMVISVNVRIGQSVDL